MDLFHDPSILFEKTAMGTEMPDDPNRWPQDILQQLFKQVPFMSDFQPHVTMDKVDGEKGYGFGHITVMNQTEVQQGSDPAAMQAAGIRQVRVPVIVKDGKLSPLDLMVTDDSKVLPLTESRLRASVFRPQAFDVTGRSPGDQSMIGMLYPPYRQNYGFGGGGVAMNVGMGKESSALETYLEKDAKKKCAMCGKEKCACGMGKSAAELTQAGREHVKEKNFAIPKGEGPGDTGKYPIHDEAHARNALTRVRQFGTPEEKSKVYAAVAKKYPGLAARSSVEGVQEKAKESSVLKAIAPTVNETDLQAFKDALGDDNVRLMYEKNAAATLDALKILLEQEPNRQKFASTFGSLIRPSVRQVIRVDEGYLVKSANHKFWDPAVRVLDRGSAIQELGPELVKAADLSGAVTEAEGATATEQPAEGQAAPDSDMQQMGPVSDFGLYKVQSDDGKELVGYVIPNLIDVDGTEVPIALFTNGSVAAVQTDILGVPAEDGQGVELPTADAPVGYGCFVSEEAGGVKATIPVELSGSFQSGEGEPVVHQGQTFDGRPVEVSVQPNIQTVVGSDGRMLVPQHWRWMPLDKANEASLASAEPEVDKQASALRSFASVEVRSGGSDFSISGPPVDKLASDQRSWLNLDEAMFLLAGLGVEQNYGVTKLAEASAGSAPVRVKIGRFIKTAEEQAGAALAASQEIMERMPRLRQPLFKEAAVLSDPEAVDAVLSLGFINTENITTFISYLPMLESAQAKMCDLLMASRLGMSAVPEEALEKSIRSTEEVLEGLKTIAFEMPSKAH